MSKSNSNSSSSKILGRLQNRLQRCRVIDNRQSYEQESSNSNSSSSKILGRLQKIRKCNFRSACPFGIKLNSLLSQSGKQSVIRVGGELVVCRTNTEAITVPVSLSDLREWSDETKYQSWYLYLFVVVFGVALAILLYDSALFNKAIGVVHFI